MALGLQLAGSPMAQARRAAVMSLSAVHAGCSLGSLTLGMLALVSSLFVELGATWDKWQWSLSWSMHGASRGSSLACCARGYDMGVPGCACSAAPEPGAFPSDAAAAVPLKRS